MRSGSIIRWGCEYWLPLQWYVNVIQNLLGWVKTMLQVLLATDSPFSSEIIEIERLIGCHVISRIKNSDVVICWLCLKQICLYAPLRPTRCGQLL